MKQIASYLILPLVLSISLNSCSSNLDEQSNSPISKEKKGIVEKRLQTDCPEGQSAVLEYSFDEFRFHRPAKDCESGFWFCTKGGSGWHIECRPNAGLTASIVGTTANVWAKEVDDKMEIHFPLELKNTEGYTAEDLSTFNVDEEYTIYEGITLKPGDYPVTETDTELVVIVDLM